MMEVLICNMFQPGKDCHYEMNCNAQLLDTDQIMNHQQKGKNPITWMALKIFM